MMRRLSLLLHSPGTDGGLAISLHPQVIYLVPDETARVARAAFPKGNVYLRMRDSLGMIYDDLTFAALFPAQGQLAASPFPLALTLVMQFTENVCGARTPGLEVCPRPRPHHPGFDASVLSEFRSRLIAGGAEQLLLDTMLTLFRAEGLLKPRGKQRTDSTHVLPLHGSSVHSLP